MSDSNGKRRKIQGLHSLSGEWVDLGWTGGKLTQMKDAPMIDRILAATIPCLIAGITVMCMAALFHYAVMWWG